MYNALVYLLQLLKKKKKNKLTVLLCAPRWLGTRPREHTATRFSRAWRLVTSPLN